MADAKVPETEVYAESAYAAAPDAVTPQPGPPVSEEEAGAVSAAHAEAGDAPTELPSKAKRGRKPRTAASAPIAVIKKTPRKPVAAKAKRAAKATNSNTKNTHTASQLKDKIMANTKAPDFAKGIQDAIADAQGKAKIAFEKSASSFGDITEFTKGNVEALVESGKIFAAGAQDFGSTYVAESRAAFETLTADVKELASSKTPTDFFKLQGDLMRRNFDAAVAASSKNSEVMLKLVNEAFAPISGRVSQAIDKAKTAA